MDVRYGVVFCLALCFMCSGKDAFGQYEEPTCSSFEECCDGCFEPTVQWSLSAEALWLQRASGSPIAEARDLNGGLVSQAFAGNNFEPGLRLELMRTDVDGNSWQIGYFGLQQWGDDEVVIGDPLNFTTRVSSPSLVLDDLVGGFDAGIAFSYRARTHNAEANRWWLQLDNDRWTVQSLAGVRYFEFHEQLLMIGIDTNLGAEFLDAVSFNALIGAQIGGKVERKWDRVSIYGLGKAGLYANNWTSRVTDIAIAGFVLPVLLRNDLSNGTSVAGLLETRTGLDYRLTNSITLRADYTVLYVPGVTLQPSPNGAGGRPSDGLVLHGASAGLVFEW